jgi:hypothetical protein
MGNIRLYGSTSGYTELAPPAVAPDGVLSLPSGTGTIATTTDQGLVHINTTTFTTQSAVNFNNVFSSSYNYYRILLDHTGSTSANIQLRMRNAGTDNSTSNYASQYVDATSTSVTGARSSAQSLFAFGAAVTSGAWQVLDVMNPFLASPTLFHVNAAFAVTLPVLTIYAGAHNVSSSFDGISFFPNAGTFTGTIRIYGYKNS